MLLLVSVAGYGADKNKNKLKNMPVSRWREIKRMSPDSAVHAFTDTLFLAFRPHDSFMYRNTSTGFVYRGGYTISDDSLLDLGTDRYRIVSKTPVKLVLTNQRGIFELGVDNSDTVKQIVIEKEEKILPVTDIDQMIGRWTVYKRGSDGPTTIEVEKNIRSVFVTGPSTEGKLGFIYGGADADNNPSWYIKSLGADQFLDCDGKGPRNIKVVKCQKGEMILEESGIRYYCKQFK